MSKISIFLPAEPKEDLNWEKPLQQAREAILQGQQVQWEFSLGLEAPYFPLEDELYFHSLSFALNQFTQQVWPEFQNQTAGASIYRGTADFSCFFEWTPRQEANWQEWKEGRGPLKESHLKRLFCAEAYVAYLQMLAHKLPDEMPITLHLDAGGMGSLAPLLHLLSPERFEHFILEIEGVPHFTQEARLGVCFPDDRTCTSDLLDRLDQIFASLKEPFRVVPESLLTERWDGLDAIYVLSEAVSSQGKRKLQGFCAAGGTVITEGPLLHLPQEVSIEQARSDSLL